MTKIVEVSIKELKAKGWQQIGDKGLEEDVIVVYNLDRTLTQTAVYPYHDIILSDWFSNPLEPTETELALFELHFGYRLKFIGDI